MEKELLLLRKLYTNPGITQRDMAKATGISLGSVNALIKELVNRGIVTVEKMTQRTMMYNLTSQGLRQRAECTYRYIVEAYAFIKELSQRIDDLLNTNSEEEYTLALFGERDEIYELIVAKLNQIGTKCKYTNSFELLNEFSNKYNLLVIVWQPESIDVIKKIKCSYIDLLDHI